MNNALKYALCLLKFRPRSEYELFQRLKKHGFAEDVISQTIEYLKEKRFVNDADFVRILVESGIRKQLGVDRIIQELKIKGINENLIEQSVETYLKNYNQDEVIKELLRRRIERFKGISPPKAKRRIYLYLLRRGFPAEKIRAAIM